MLELFKTFIIEKKLFQPSESILLAVSGGIDSVVMCDLFDKAGLEFGIAHCNFQLRGKESEKDQLFVQDLAKKYKRAFHMHRFDTGKLAAEKGISTQMAARELRYEWFTQLLQLEKYALLATAHHGNDVLETMLLNFSRGTGISGLHGIAAKQGNKIRPLLFADRKDIEVYAMQQKLKWRDDSSNASSKYKRNLIRNEVIPLLKKINPNLEETSRQTAARISAVEQFFSAQVEEIKQKVVTEQKGVAYIDLRLLMQGREPAAVLFELLRQYNFSWSNAENIISSANGISGKRFLSESHELVKDRGRLVVTTLAGQDEETQKLSIQDGAFRNPYIVLQAEVLHNDYYTIPDTSSIASLDFDKLSFPLTIRKWKLGDRFHPLGMKGEKKLSDFLIDLKIPVNIKEKVYVLLSDDEIAWVIGYRVAEGFKIDKSTATIYKLSLL